MRENSGDERLSYLLTAYINNRCTRQELEELFLLMGQINEEQLRPLLRDQWADARDRQPVSNVDWDRLYEAMMNRSRLLDSHPVAEQIVPLRSRRTRRFRVAAAVLLLFLVAGVTFFQWSRVASSPSPAAPVVKRYKNDVKPGGNKAILTLADGSSIVLDSANNGTISMQGNTKIIKLADGRLAYHGANRDGASVLYNTISTPRGGQYQIVLPDGSKVWLDATSSLRFPTAFGTGQRKVELSGEAYFEIAANPQEPFIVSVLSQQKNQSSEVEKVMVLGTRFNVNAYADEKIVKTTLLDGTVEVAGPAGGTKLAPGEQAQLNQNDQSHISVTEDVDVDAAVAWKNGYFDFNRADIHTIMRQLSRWYDVDVAFLGSGAGKEFYGGMQRDLPLSAIFRILEKSGVEFSIDGKKVIVNM